jgi:Smg protein
MATQLNEETMDILIYLFENYLNRESMTTLKHRQIFEELEQAGFQPEEIQYAIAALEAIREILNVAFGSATKELPAVRVFSRQECRKLDVLARGFILLFEQLELLDIVTRERVIEQAMDLNIDEVSLEELKWVILSVLLNQPAIADFSPLHTQLSTEEVIGRLH